MTIKMVNNVRLGHLLLLALSISFTGCGVLFGDEGYFRNREDDYLKADVIPPLKVPADLDSGALGELYVIPPITEVDEVFRPDSTRYTVPRPQPLATNMLEEQVRIQRLGSDRWVLINVPPGEVWPRVRNFLSLNGLTVERADIGLGLIETGWVEFRTDPENYDRYRLQIDQGVQPDTSEIHILHMSVPRAQLSSAAEWPARSASDERERWLLEELAATLASEGGEAGTSLLAQGIGGDTKAGLRLMATEPVLNIRLDRERALATLTHAMDQNGFTILDRDVAAGIYYLHYEAPSTKKPGWFSRRFGKASRPKPEPTSPYTLDALLTNLPTANILEQTAMSDRRAERQLPNAPGYLLIVDGEPGDINAYLRDPYGKRLPPRQARDLLSVLRNNLI